MTFGFLGDVIFGLAVGVAVGAWLDYRKNRWTGRRRRKP